MELDGKITIKVGLSQLSQRNHKKAKQPTDVYSPAFSHRQEESIFIHCIYSYWYAGLMTSYFLEHTTNFRWVCLCWAATLQNYLNPDLLWQHQLPLKLSNSSSSYSYKAQCKVQPLSFWSTGSGLWLTQECDIFILCCKYPDWGFWVNKNLGEVAYLTDISPQFTDPCQHLRDPTSQGHISVQWILALLGSLCGHDWTMT